MVKIVNGIPDDWQNNDDQETDAAYLFESIDTENIINELPIKKDSIMANTTFVQVRVAQALKDEVTDIYDYYGPDLPTVVRIFMKKKRLFLCWYKDGDNVKYFLSKNRSLRLRKKLIMR